MRRLCYYGLRTELVLGLGAIAAALISNGSYKLAYATVMTIMFFGLSDKHWEIRSVFAFLLLYLSIALVNIGSYRGETSIQTAIVYSVDLACLYIMMRLGLEIGRLGIGPKSARSIGCLELTSLFPVAVVIHLTVVGAVLGFVVMTYGNIFVAQYLRVEVPTELQYALKSTAYIPFVAFVAGRKKMRWRHILLYGFLPMLPVVAVGARGVVAMIALGLIMGLYWKARVRRRMVSWQSKTLEGTGLVSWLNVIISFAVALVVYGLYYIRRFTTPGYLEPSEMIVEYFGGSNPAYYVIAPIYLSLKETVGLAGEIISSGIGNDLVPLPLVVADLRTMLPGEQLAAGRALASQVGSVVGGGVTPGLVGGIHIDFPNLHWVVWAVTGLLLGMFLGWARRSPRWTVLGILAVIEFAHLFHRGFFKPEYIFAFGIVGFYLALTREWYPECGSARIGH